MCVCIVQNRELCLASKSTGKSHALDNASIIKYIIIETSKFQTHDTGGLLAINNSKRCKRSLLINHLNDTFVTYSTYSTDFIEASFLEAKVNKNMFANNEIRIFKFMITRSASPRLMRVR